MMEKFAVGVIDTNGKFATGNIDISGAPWPVNISANFWKSYEMMGLGEDDSWKKLKQKTLWHCPFINIFAGNTLKSSVKGYKN